MFFPRQAGFAAKWLIVAIALIAALAVAAEFLPRLQKISLHDLEAKYTTTDSRFADVDGVRVHYMDQGSGPVIVILHASFMNLRSWDPVVEKLSEKYRVIRLDFLTAGLTGPEPDDRYSFDRNLELVDELTRQLGVDEFAVVGTSSGGIVAFNYAARFPDKVARLILINSAGMPRNAKTNPNRPRGTRLGRWLASRWQTRAKVRDNLDLNFIEPNEPPDWLVDMNHDMSLRKGLQREGALLIANFRTGDPQAVLANVTAPTLVGWGLENQTVFHLEADVFGHWLINAPSLVKKYPGLGHYPYIEDPDLLVGEIDGFLSGAMDDQLIRHKPAATKPANVSRKLRYRTVTGADGLPLQVVEAGPQSAPGILFIHGWSLSSSSWQQQLESSLADEFHLVAVDLRGHGNSGKPWSPDAYNNSRTWADDVAAAIKATGLEKPVIVAWSYGGHVAMDYVRHYSAANLAGIVFVGSTGGMQPFPPPDAETAASFARLGALAMSADAGARLQAAREFVAGMVQAAVPDNILEREAAAVLAITPMVRTAMMGRALDNSDLVGELQLPVLFLMGDAERTTVPEKVELLLKAIPDAKMSIYPQTGHMPFIERTAKFNADIKNFADPSG